MKKNEPHTGKWTEISRRHKEKLGMEVPENYFSSSKQGILEKVSASRTHSAQVFYLKPVFRYAIAAAITLLVGLGITLRFLPDNNVGETLPGTVNIELETMKDEDYLITSILVKDQDLDGFLDQYLLEGILVKAELREQEFDDTFMNSLLVKDSLIDTYIDDYYMDDIIF